MATQQKQNRGTLKNYFKKGSLPSEKQFGNLIDSMLNIVDDGFEKTAKEGMKLFSMGDYEKLISFYRQIDVKSPVWSISINQITENFEVKNKNEQTLLSIDQEGQVGINKKRPEHTLDVNGVVGAKGRTGTFKQGTVPADGKWHTLLKNLDGCRAYEVIAGAGKKKEGKYALVHSIVLSTFNSENRVSYNQAYYNTKCNRIELCWDGEQHNFALKMKTKCDYGENAYIQYNISELWHDYYMDESDPMYRKKDGK